MYKIFSLSNLRIEKVFMYRFSYDRGFPGDVPHSMTCRSLTEFLTPLFFFSIIDFSTIMTSIDKTIVDLNLQKMLIDSPSTF